MKNNFTRPTQFIGAKTVFYLLFTLLISVVGSEINAQAECAGEATVLAKWDINGGTDCNGERNTANASAPIFTGGKQLCPSFNDGCGQTVMFTKGFGNTFNFRGAICLAGFWAKGTRRYGNAYKASPNWDINDTEFRPENEGGQIFIRYNFNAGQAGTLTGFSLVFRQSGFVPGGIISHERQGVSVWRNGILIHSDVMDIVESNVNGTPIVFTFPNTADFSTDGSTDVNFEVGFGLVQRNADFLTGYDDMCILGSKGTANASVTAVPATCPPGGGMDGQLIVQGFSPGERYDFTEGTSYTGSATFATATVIPADGIIVNNLPAVEVATSYTIRVFREDCYLEETVVLPPTFCPYTCDFPDATVTPNPASCAGDNTRNDDASIVLTGITNMDRVGFSEGKTYSGPDYAEATPLPAMATTFSFDDLAADACKKFYTIRLFNGGASAEDQENCIQDITVSIDPVSCDGCAIICADLVGTDSELINPPTDPAMAEACKEDGFVDIDISKTVDVATGESCPGNTEFTWTLTVTNDGTMTATDIVVRDLFPENIIVSSATATSGLVLRSDEHIDWQIATLDALASTTLTVVSVFTEPGSYQNCASLVNVFPANDTNTANDESCDEVTVTGTIRPSIEKEFSPLFGQANVPFRLTIKLFNNDTLPIALTADLVDDLPSTPGQMTVAAAPNLVTSLPGVVADASGTSITVPSGTVLQPGLTNIQVDVVAPVDGFYINEIPAEALQTTGCSNPEPAEATIDLNAAYVIAPIIDKAFDADMLAVGDQTTLTLTVDNRNAQNFVVAADFTDEMPAGLMVTGAVGGTCPGVSTFSSTNMVGIVRGTTLTPGPCTITVQVEGTDPGLHCNLIQYNSLMVDVTLPGGAVVSTSNQDLAEACIEVVNNPIFDLALRKTLAPMQSDTVDAGGSVSFAITIFNQGTTTGTDIQITDYISSDLTLIDDATWEISGDDAILENPIPSLAPGADTTIIIQFDIDAGFTGESITNLAEISGANGGTDKDSTPDGNETNDNGGLVQSPSDDVILGDPTTGGGAPFDENGLTDEDDADPAIVFLRILPEDLNCTMVLSATPGDCVPASGTYDLTGSITFSNAPATGSLTISVDGVVAETIMSFTSPQSFTATGLAADGLQHSVSAAFSDDPACNASLDYTAPVSCADAGACTVSLTAVPGDCDPADNSYALSGQITFADAPASGTVTVSVGPFSQTYTLPATSPLDYQLTGLASDGSSQTVSVSFSENAACTNTADFVAPATCLPGECSLALTASPGTCAPATNLFSITGDLTISNAPATGSLTISTAGASTTFAVNALPTTYTLSGLVSDGSSRTVTATFTDDAGCTASVDIDSPESCSDPDPACAISMDLTPSPCVDGNYSVSGTVSFVDPPASGNIIVSDAGATLLTIALPTSSPLSFTLPGLMADGLTETLTVEFSEDATCTNTASFTAPAACMDPCDVMATATEVSCDDNGTAQDATDDYITFKLNPTGTSLGASYSVSVSAGQVFTSGGSPATGIPYGTETMFRLTNGSIGAGDVTVTVTDDTSPGCSTTTDVTDPITPCSDCIDPTTTLTPTASTCTDATENNDGTITWTSATNATHYGVSSADAAMYDGPTTTASATAAPVDGTEIVTGVVHAGASYIVRVFNMDDDCFVDVPVTVDAGAVCMEPACDLMITNISVDCTNGTEFTVSFEVAWDFANATTDMIEVTVDGDAQTPFTPGTAMGTQAFGPITVTGPANDILLEATFLTNTSCNTTALVDLIACTPDCVNGSGTVGGNVFNDFNNDGADAGAGEVGQANVLVEVYDCDGMLVCSVYTNADGNWSCDGLNDAEEYRVEFSTPLQPYLQPSFAGMDNGTNTQFVTAPSCEVDYGVVDPSDCGGTTDGDAASGDVTLVTTCFIRGDINSPGGQEVLVSWDYDENGTASPAILANNDEIGSVWGVASSSNNQKVYTATFLKRGAGLGPNGLGAIYEHDLATGANSLFLDLASLGIPVGSMGTRNLNDLRDPEAFALVGKAGLGDIGVSEDGSTLYVVNLFNQTLYAIDVSSQGIVGTFPVPDPGCLGGDFSAFAVTVNKGNVYVGGVCTAEESQNRADLQATVYQLVAGTFAEVYSFPLDYRKGRPGNTACPTLGNWQPWTDDFSTAVNAGSLCNNDPGPNRGTYVYPVPMLTDIEFDTDGSMILGFLDRFAHQLGSGFLTPFGASTRIFTPFAGGDILRVCNVDGTFVLEGSAGCASNANNNQGPGGGEYYFGDAFQQTTPVVQFPHAETSNGGLYLQPGSGEVILSAYDPVNGGTGQFGSGGIIALDNQTGEKVRARRLYSSNGDTFAKGHGIGDVEGFCAPLPIQIGNYVWLDTDEDGVQDACEDSVPEGLPVTLYTKDDDGTLTQVATTTTSATGEYYFTSDGTTGETWTNTGEAIIADTSYVIVFGDQSGEIIPLNGVDYNLTAALTGEGNSTTLNDSDGVLFDLNGTMVPAICYNTADTTDHTLDVGFIPAPMCDLYLVSITPNCTYSAATGQSTFTVDVEVGWNYTALTGSDQIAVTLGGQMMTIDPAGMNSDTVTVNFANVAGPAYDLPISAEFDGVAGCTIAGGVDLIACTDPCVDGPGVVGGNVFNDFNNDGADAGAEEVGQANVKVEVYDCDGALVCDTWTNADGNWSCDGLNDAEEYRVEFSTPLQDYLAPSFAGTDNGTNTQVVTAPTCEVDYGVVNPEDYCQENPTMATACYQSGDPLRAGTTAGSDVLVSFPYDASGVGTNALVPFGIPASAPIAQKDATAAQIGSTWGMAWERSTQTLYAAAMVKRHVGIGPLGEGGIYKLDYSVDPANPIVTPWLDVNTLGMMTGTVGTGATPAARNMDRGLAANTGTATIGGDQDAFDKVGKVGLGDIDITTDGTTLWVINLFDQSLNSISLNDGGTPALSETFVLPNDCSSGDQRPFAVKVHQGEVYVGVVCDAALEAFVYRLDGNTFVPVSISGTSAIDLSYTKGLASNNCPTENGWFNWKSTPAPACSGGVLWVHPTPMLCDIEFDVDGSMILAFMDRSGHQFGANNTQFDGTGFENYHAAGDILRICNIDGNFFMQGNGGCPINIANSANPSAASGNDRGRGGPGGGEFYYQDEFLNGGTTLLHGETVMGGLALHPQTGEVAVISYDPYGTVFVSGGVNWFNNTDGTARDPGYLIYVGEDAGGTLPSGTFGKAAGLGDLELFCDPLPIQIGNYVWEDTDEDGVQDACEDPIEGLPVTLYTKADDGSLTQVATTTTSATGEYYFTGDGTTGETWTNTGEAIIADTSYVIVFGDQSGETIMLAGLEYELTAALTGEGNGPTLNDSDGVLFDLNGTMVPAICYNTADTTDHTLDVGLLPISTFDLALRKSLASGQSNMAAANDEVVFTITVFNQGTLGASDVEVTDYLPTNTTYSATSSTATGMLTSGGNDVVNLTNNGGGTFSLDTLPPMDSVSFNLALTIDAAASGTLTNTAEIVAATGGMDEDSPLTSVIGMSDDDSELASNDDINDDGLDTPGTEDLMGDEDDYDLEQIIICNLSITSIDAACQPNQTGKYDVTVNLSYENGPGGLITATLGTGQMASSTATTAGSGTTTITFTGLSSTNMAGITVDVAFDDAANCNAQSTFDAPVNCCPLPQPICEMDNESYTLTADPGLTNYQWSVDGTPISGADQQSYMATMPGTYTWEALDGSSCPVVSCCAIELEDNCNPIFDLALVKRLDTSMTPGPFAVGDLVTFEIEVYNQGEVEARRIEVKDYYPDGLTLAAVSAGEWTVSNDTVILTNPIATLSAGDSAVLSVTFMIDPTFSGTELTNRAEISEADDDDNPNNDPPMDEDSTPDDNGDTPPETGTPDEYDDDSPGSPGDMDDPTDEDDYDFETIMLAPPVFDLALVKRLDTGVTPGPFSPGDPVTFEIEVYNQGEVDAFAVEVSDYVPTGLTWVPGGDFTGATPVATVANIVAGDSAALTINFTIDTDAFAGNLVNYAEITAADDDNIPDNTPPTDEDSTPGDNEGLDEMDTDNDIDDDNPDYPGTMDNPSDNDDYDPASILVIIDLELCDTGDECSFLIDFETDENGNPLVAGTVDIFTNQPYANVFGPGEGLTFSTDNQAANPLNLYDTDGAGGNDADLEFSGMWAAGNIITEPIGNVLIINQTTDLSDPNDFANGGDIIVDSDRPLGRFAFEMIDLDFPVQGDVTFTNTPLGTSVTIDFADFEQGSGSPFEVQGVIFGDRTANRVISATAANLGLPFFDRVTFNMPDQSGAIGVICATVNQKFDLALVKRLDAGATPGPFTPGSTVTFELEVYNQGGEDAVDIVVSDYVPEGLSLAPASAPDWVTEVDTVRLRDSIDIVAGDSAVLSVSFVIDADFMGDSLTNRAEISYFDDDGNPSTEPPLDNDSTPGDNGNDDPEADTPDEYDDENPNAPGTEDDPNDEDDYDWEGIPVVQTFDLALIKQIDTLTTPGPFTFESTVAYNLHVTNQGALDATDVTVADYIPAGLTLVPSTDWSLDADTARLVNAFDLAAGDTMTLAISFTIDPDFSGEGITNTAEITTADNALGLPDEDSVPGDNGGDDPEVDTDDEDDDDGPNGNGNPDDPNDSDDFDLARVSLETVSLGSTIFLDNNNDGFQNGADTGIANVEVQLFEAVTETQVRTDATGSRVTNPADAATVVTDVDGNYLFDNLLPGDYYVVIPTAPAAAPLSSNNAGVAFTETDPDDNRDNDDEGIQLSRGASVSSDTITLTLGEEPVNGAVAGAETAQGAMQDDAFDGNGNMTLDFGFFAPVSVGDTAFVDLDGNGLQDVDDPGIGGVTVVLLDSNGDTATVDADGNTITGVATTDPDGSYLFDNLPPGSYSVVFDLSTADDADNYVFTTPNAGDDTDDSDNSIALSDSTAQSDPTPFLNSGEEDLTLDVGVRCNVSVTVADPFTICATQPIDLTVGATVTPDTTTTFGATWTTPDGTGDFVDADGNVITTEPYRFGTAVAYLPSAADARRGEVTLVLTTDDPTGPCEPVSASVIIQVLKVDCGEFMWDGTND